MGEPVRVSTYAELRQALEARRRALGLSQEVANDRAGLADRYWAKLAVGMRHFGEMSLEAVLGALSVELVVVPADPMRARPAKQALRPALVALPSPEKFAPLTRQQKGGRARAQKLSALQRSESASRAARARWKRHFKKRPRACRPPQSTPEAIENAADKLV